MENHSSITEFDFQTAASNTFHPQSSRPLKGALIHASQAKLYSQHARRQAVGRLKLECLDRITETLKHLCLALEHLEHAEEPSSPDLEHIHSHFFREGETRMEATW